MGVDAGNLVVAIASAVISVGFTLWFVRRQTNAAVDQAKSARDAAVAAERQVAISEQVRREQSEPYVVVDIRPSEHVSSVFVLVIENIGPTVARNVRIVFDPPLKRVSENTRSGWKPIQESLLLKQGIPAMPPGRRMEWFFDLTFERFASSLPMAYTATVNAEGPGGRQVETMTYRIDLAVYGGLNRLGIKGVHDGVKTLNALKTAAERIAVALERHAPGDH